MKYSTRLDLRFHFQKQIVFFEIVFNFMNIFSNFRFNGKPDRYFSISKTELNEIRIIMYTKIGFKRIHENFIRIVKSILWTNT